MSAQNLPSVSVIMPVRNEADLIERSLGAAPLARTTQSNLLEVIVARRNVERWNARNNFIPAKYTCEPANRKQCWENRPDRYQRRHGGRDTADIIVRIDGHCEIAPDYVRRCVEHLENGEADGVGGPIETVGQTYLARVIACAMSSNFGVGGSAFRTGSKAAILTDTIAFPAYTRAITERAGAYDEELVRNQDDEYNYRIRKLGGRLLLAPDIRSRYFSRGSLRSLWRQYLQYGYWKVRVMQKHPRQMRARQFVPLHCLRLSCFPALWPSFRQSADGRS